MDVAVTLFRVDWLDLLSDSAWTWLNRNVGLLLRLVNQHFWLNVDVASAVLAGTLVEERPEEAGDVFLLGLDHDVALTFWKALN